MKTRIRRFISMLMLAALVAVTIAGCKTPPVTTKALVKSAVQVGVSVGVSQEPDAIPYLRIAAPVICEASKGTNVQPEWVIAQLQNNASANALKTPNAVMIFNSAFGIYQGLYEAYGAEGVAERAQLQAWLSGTCEGILAGLPPVGGLNAASRRTLPPHIKK